MSSPILGGSTTSRSGSEHSVLLNNEEVRIPEVPLPPEMDLDVTSKESLYENLVDIKKMEAEEIEMEINQSRSVFIMRHGERIDFTFGSWIPYCFDDTGKYIRKDLNMPKTLPERTGGSAAFLRDTPLTNVGIFEAKLVGESLKDNNITIDHVYCSPSYRCVQTCDSVLRGLNRQDKLPIKIEPGLFEWMAWYLPDNIPSWLSKSELTHAGFNIDENYVPFVAEKELKESRENCEQFYLRCAFVTRSALQASPKGNILLVGHTSNLDTCSRDLLGEKPRLANEMTKVIQKIPYCSLVEVRGNGNTWQLVEPPCMPITHSTNQRFDWRVLL